MGWLEAVGFTVVSCCIAEVVYKKVCTRKYMRGDIYGIFLFWFVSTFLIGGLFYFTAKTVKAEPSPVPSALPVVAASPVPPAKTHCWGVKIQTTRKLTKKEKDFVKKVYADQGKAYCLIADVSCGDCIPFEYEEVEAKK